MSPRPRRWWTFKGRSYWWDRQGNRWVLLPTDPVALPAEVPP